MQLDSTRSSCLANDGGSKGIDEGGGGYFPQCRQKPGPQKKCKTHFIVKVYAGKAYFLHEDIFFFLLTTHLYKPVLKILINWSL